MKPSRRYEPSQERRYHRVVSQVTITVHYGCDVIRLVRLPTSGSYAVNVFGFWPIRAEFIHNMIAEG